MDKIFADKGVARIFFILFGSLSVGLIALSALLHASPPGPWTTYGAELTDKFLISFLVTVMLGSFLFYIAPRYSKELDVTPLSSGDIRKNLLEALDKTSAYSFLGATGRFVKASVIPSLIASYIKEQRKCRLELILLDPQSEDACAAYARYRKSLGLSETTTRETVHVRADICATVIAAMRASAEMQLNVEIHLLPVFGVFRVDYSDACAIVTKEHPSAAGLRCAREGHFYKLWRAEIDARRHQGRSFASAAVVPRSDDNGDLRRYLVGSNLISEAVATDELVAEVAKAIKAPDPYQQVSGIRAAKE